MRAEDARLMNDMNGMKQGYVKLYDLNRWELTFNFPNYSLVTKTVNNALETQFFLQNDHLKLVSLNYFLI